MDTPPSLRTPGQQAMTDEGWHQLFEHSAIGVTLADLEGHLVHVNRAYCAMLGYTEVELEGHSYVSHAHPDDRARHLILVRELLADARAHFQVEERYVRKGGSVMWVSNSVSLVPPRGGSRRILILGLVEDITERMRLRDELDAERNRLRLLLDVNELLVAHLDLREMFQALASSLRRVTDCHFIGLALPDAATGELRQHIVDHPDGKGAITEGMVLPLHGSASGKAFRTGAPVLLNDPEANRQDPDLYGTPEGARFYRTVLEEGVPSGYVLPLVHRGEVLGVLQLKKYADARFKEREIEFMSKVAGQLSIAVANALEYREVKESKERLDRERVYLKEEIRSAHDFEEIIGVSRTLKQVLGQIDTVAVTDSTVLILGETGTGKELIARAIHNRSRRRDRPFVKVNCSAIPTGLLESELFGHERGAFTGATAPRIGRFEAADQGTLFLDEIGDLPVDLQPKLLRVLQEREFERLGASRTRRVDVRVVAATNRGLATMVGEGRFREDLYYRLNVFPITLPPLRERAGDIPLLVRHFVGVYARRMGKQIDHIPDASMRALVGYHWPGNVRELQNVIERAVILTPGAVLELALAERAAGAREDRPDAAAPNGHRTLQEVEREHILGALQEAKWVIGGPNGAAARLGLRRTSLMYRMEKLGIARPT
ncbi:sigma 54-interacting transcriptional regulator [Anaeromyxobacter sp. Fw109-5]|uniref:sigma 54-interacting transcriptional regulator n=1 Tax=Anaeromyxobacter sp. (strain Fw109-5) TaxID=404589 RepID=UPI0002F061EB|nr:sigma 54-interacting transcriptional regulator [Anaeromyxobacter sp. Fw109-5]